MGIFKQQRFTCGGCGQVRTAKGTVKPEQAQDPLGPPPGWSFANVTAQHPVFGAIGSLTVFFCAPPCGEQIEKGEGASATLIAEFQRAFARNANHTLAAVPDAPPAAPAEGFDAPKVE
jgi:hypothetical protein